MDNLIVLVDESDREVGFWEKIQVHRAGKLHRAFSIFLINDKKEIMLQKRAPHKYHSGGLWSNTCCGHPRMGEDLKTAAERRLAEEMGLTCKLEEGYSFIYKVNFGIISEFEYDHCFIGFCNNEPVINPDEVEDWKWASLSDLLNEIEKNPENFTFWLPLALKGIEKIIENQY